MQNEKFLFFLILCVCNPPSPLPSLGTARWQSSSSAVLFIHSSCLMGVLLLLSFREAMCWQNDTCDKRKLLFSEQKPGWGARGQQPGRVLDGVYFSYNAVV